MGNGFRDPKALMERIRQIASEQSGVPLGKVKNHSRFVADLGMD